MKIEITKDAKNPLLKRREVEFRIESKITPSRAETKSELAKALKANEALLVVDLIDQKMGSNVTTGRAKVYEDADALKAIELSYKLQRGVKKKEGEAAAKPAEAPKK